MLQDTVSVSKGIAELVITDKSSWKLYWETLTIGSWAQKHLLWACFKPFKHQGVVGAGAVLSGLPFSPTFHAELQWEWTCITSATNSSCQQLLQVHTRFCSGVPLSYSNFMLIHCFPAWSLLSDAYWTCSSSCTQTAYRNLHFLSSLKQAIGMFSAIHTTLRNDIM